MNPLYLFYLINKDVFSPDMEGTQYGMRLSANSGFVIRDQSYNTSPTIPVFEYTKVVFDDKEVIVCFFDSNHEYISGYSGSNLNLVRPKNAESMAFCYTVEDWNSGNISIELMYKAKPIFKDDLAKTYSKESGQEFFREGLNGEVRFMCRDYYYILRQPFDTIYYFDIYRSNDGGRTFESYVKTKFMRTDCTINIADLSISVKPEYNDSYTDLLNGWEREYDLVKLNPALEKISLYRRGILQIYVAGDDKVSCALSGVFWEQDADVVTDTNELVNKYYYWESGVNFININVTGDNLAPNLQGNYTATLPFKPTKEDYEKAIYRLPNNRAYIKPAAFTEITWKFYIYDVTGQVMGVSQPIYSLDPTTVDELTFTNYYLPSQIIGHGYASRKRFYTRYVTASNPMNSKPPIPSGVAEVHNKPSDDMTSTPGSYPYIVSYSFSTFRVSNIFKQEPSEWGQNGRGEYYYPPTDIAPYKAYPVNRDMWTDDSSYWFIYDFSKDEIEPRSRLEYTMSHAMPLHSVLSVLLDKVAPGITFKNTTEYSQFFYAASRPIGGGQRKVYMTPKSNILVSNYTQPAQKATITLKSVLDMLKNVYQCYWYIEDNKLKIEHIQYFRNGQSYTNQPGIELDLTKWLCPSNGRSWETGRKQYKFEKLDMPERYQFSWMDDVTEPFTGYPIVMRSNFVKQDKIEEISVNNFSTDIDYMILRSDEFSKDGFTLMETITQAGRERVPVLSQLIDGDVYQNQNGYLSYFFLHPNYWGYNLPTKNVNINNTDMTLRYISRLKSQGVKFPFDRDISPLKLIHTSIGDGKVESISVNLSSRMHTIDLRYDTEGIKDETSSSKRYGWKLAENPNDIKSELQEMESKENLSKSKPIKTN